MATASVTPETLITIKISLEDSLKKIKLPLKDLNAYTLPAKLKQCLFIPVDSTVIFERYSDSAGGFIELDHSSVPAYKALVRAAKAKGKLRIKATIKRQQEQEDFGMPQPLHAETSPPAYPVAFQAPMSDHLTGDAREIPTMTTPLVPALRDVKSAFVSPDMQKIRNSRPLVSEAPIPQPFVATNVPLPYTVAFRPREQAKSPAIQAAWSVYCNICDVPMANAHYHCGTCDNGDYDLCESCVGKGLLCPGEGHWLIKRFIQDGKVVSSVTERVGKKVKEEQLETKVEIPGAFNEEVKVLAPEPQPQPPARTCNNCVVVLPERDFVNCNVCKDFDLCITCHITNTHGHHPAHAFSPVAGDAAIPLLAKNLLKSGRNVMHNAFCDGCDKKIFGVRHKCLNCPDWDYCSDCVATADAKHPNHRFAAIYEQLQEPKPNYARHFGVFCDGPLCSGKIRPNYIQGVRYKCAVCHDTDFCANCEALPGNTHNRTHPLIKFQTPVRNVNVQTINSNNDGRVRTMGDKSAEPVIKAENAETPVQTMAEIAPSDVKSEEKRPSSHAGQPKDGDVPSPRASVAPLSATFVRDSVADGTVIAPGAKFIQIWTLRNDGPGVWPAGCSVKFTGGDNMLNVDNGHPSSVASIAQATESSVVGREVQVGEEISFIITLKAPSREGRSISYWRLKSADGTPFGHRLWCDINVKSTKLDFYPGPPPSEPVEAPLGILPPPPHVAPFSMDQRGLDDLVQMRRRLDAISSCTGPLQAPSCTLAWPVPQQLENENIRKAQARARVDAIKAKIERYRAEHHRAHAHLKDLAVASAKSPVPAEVAPVPVKDELTEGATESPSSSLMIFPKLEKESPASSFVGSSKGKAATVETEEGEIESSAVPVAHEDVPTVEETVTSPVEEFDDLEVLSISAASDDESDDGFLTDEEYDILDASDRETVASP